MILSDENAFGLLVSFYDLEDVEYSLAPEEFTTRCSEFRSLVLATASESPLGAGATILDLGHALYFEVGDGDQRTDPVSWLKALRAALSEREFSVVAVLSHGGRWVVESGSDLPAVESLAGEYVLLSASRSSEPLRRALYAETACHGSDGGDGWGPGLYVDTEAVEALGKSLKNAPTPLSSAGATFYRIGR
jgi:hypothetical protein